MIEGGFTSAGEGGVGEPMDWEPGPGTSVERTLGAAELAAVVFVEVPVEVAVDDLAGVELVVGSATGVMGGACTAGITTGDGDAGVG